MPIVCTVQGNTMGETRETSKREAKKNLSIKRGHEREISKIRPTSTKDLTVKHPK